MASADFLPAETRQPNSTEFRPRSTRDRPGFAGERGPRAGGEGPPGPPSRYGEIAVGRRGRAAVFLPLACCGGSPEQLIGDKAYDSEGLDAQLAELGVDHDRAHLVDASGPEPGTPDYPVLSCG